MYSVPLTYVFWLLLGPLGVHRFYCGWIGTGILWAFTGGLCGIGWFVDLFLIPGLVRSANDREFRIRHSGGDAAPRTAPRVIYCTHCGGAMKVPQRSAGRPFGCPRCSAVLTVPA